MEQVVVISGLAQGIGREVAKLLAVGGHSVAGFDMDGGSLASLTDELSGSRGTHYLIEMDITNRKGILEFRDNVLDRYGRVDTVLSNVGIGFFGPFEEIDLEKALRCLEINVIGAAALLQAFIPSMRERKTGKILCMSSLVGQVPFPFESIYSASKFGLEGLVQSLKFEVEPFGIRVGIIQPAQVSTDFAAKIHYLPPEGSPYRERVKRFIDKDNELIKTAPTPIQAAEKIVALIQRDNPPRFSQIDFMSTFFLFLNRVLPGKIRDMILVNHMHIKV
jgi:short-subunit dehydrogenase